MTRAITPKQLWVFYSGKTILLNALRSPRRLPDSSRRLPRSRRLRRSSRSERPSLLSHNIFGTAADVSFGFAYSPASQTLTHTRDNDSYAWTGAVPVTRNYTTNGLNQYTAAGAATFLYDANGNLTNDGTNSYLYDVENRLVSATIGGQTVSLRYDPMGRLYEVTGATTTRFLYDGDELIGEYSTGGAMLKRYVHGIAVDDPVVQYEGSGTSSTALRHLLADRQGSVIGIADSGGNILARNTYDEYGIPKSDQGTLPVYGRFAYTGQIWLPELGMYHYKARLYSPTLGRFLQTDPIGYDDQINLYAYVGNDPVNKTDPTGRYECGKAGGSDCKAAAKAVAEIRAARNFYASKPIGSNVSRSASAAAGLTKTLSSLGKQGDGGVNIKVGDLPGGTRGQFDGNNTITLDTNQIQKSGGRVGETLGHETQHYRQRHESLSPLAAEVRPLGIQYIIGRSPGGGIGSIGGRDYIRYRLHGYPGGRLSERFSGPAIERVMEDELEKPF